MPIHCPFCKEEIKEDAIKCKHCHSLLYKIDIEDIQKQEDSKEASKYTTYILDKDLVRFSKFALSILAIFITVGIILYGVDLKQTVKELNEANSNLDGANKKITQSLPKIDSLQSEISSIKQDVEDARSKANEALAQINSSKEEAIVLVGYMKTLDPGQLAKLSEIKNTDSEKFTSKLDFQNLWKTGQTIRICFLNGTQSQKEKTQKIASEWTHFANMNFSYVTDKTNSDIRVSFNEQGMWSFVGTTCLVVSKDQPTTALLVSLDKNVTTDDRQSVLREFGFVIGLLSEQQNPNANIKWDKQKVYRLYQGAPNYWSKSDVDRNLFHTWQSKSKPFDPNSIMMIPIDKELTLNGFSTKWNTQLSELDKTFVARLYPK